MRSVNQFKGFVSRKCGSLQQNQQQQRSIQQHIDKTDHHARALYISAVIYGILECLKTEKNRR